MFDSASGLATPTEGCAARLIGHMLGTLLTPEKSTVTNLILTHGGGRCDWSADYRLYSRDRVDESRLFDKAREELLAHLAEDEPLVVGIDDTIVRKSGKKVHGSGWKRDPLGPAFQTNLVHAQRYLQFSAARPLAHGKAHMIPIDFLHAPSPGKPGKDAQPDDHQAYREALKQHNLNQQTIRRFQLLRDKVPASRRIVFTGDGSYTNREILRALPEGCCYIGRARKDCALSYLPEAPTGSRRMGRPRRYGKPAPTPEQLCTDESVPWQQVEAFASGTRHTFRIKTIGPLLWAKSGTQLPLRLVVIAPVGYRLRKGSKLLYRKPAYLLCTDPDMDIAKLIQYYLWRWGIEVNFREEKTLIGTGDAHVRTQASNQHLPAVTVAAYSLLWTAALRGVRSHSDYPATLQPPKWRNHRHLKARPPSTGDLLRLLRYEIWAAAIRPGTLYHFASTAPPTTTAQKLSPNLPAILFNAA